MKLPPWHRALVYVAIALVTVTGAGWLVCHYLLAEAGAYGRVPHPQEGRWMSLHGAAATLALFVFGSLLPTHMRGGWALGRGRLGGGAMAATMAILSLGGLGLYYVADEGFREWLGLSHWALGLALPALLVVHIKSARTDSPDPDED